MKAGLIVKCIIFMAMLQSAAAQELEYRKWDIAGTTGILGTSRRDFRTNSYYGDTLAAAWNVDAGRYLTTHWKADLGVMTTNSRSVYDYPQSYTGQGFAYGYAKVRPTTVTGAVTYQFFENTFVHPYLSAGLGLTSVSKERQSYFFVTPDRVSPTPVTSHERYTQVRPFLAGGFKTYFNERAFLKSDFSYAANSTGFSHALVRVGFGFDF